MVEECEIMDLNEKVRLLNWCVWDRADFNHRLDSNLIEQPEFKKTIGRGNFGLLQVYSVHSPPEE